MRVRINSSCEVNSATRSGEVFRWLSSTIDRAWVRASVRSAESSGQLSSASSVAISWSIQFTFSVFRSARAHRLSNRADEGREAYAAVTLGRAF